MFCRISVQRWMRRFWAKKCRRDHLRSLWRSVVLVTVLRWQRRKAAEGRWGVWPSVGLRSLWRSIVAMTVRPADSSWSSRKWSQYPDSKSCSVLERRPSTDRCAYDGPSCMFVMKFREVIPVPIFQDSMFFGTKTIDGPSCLWRSVILAIEGNKKSSRRNCTSMERRSPWRSVVTKMIHHEVRRPSRILKDFQQIESLFN